MTRTALKEITKNWCNSSVSTSQAQVLGYVSDGGLRHWKYGLHTQESLDRRDPR